jgi:hypothetical protein
VLARRTHESQPGSQTENSAHSRRRDSDRGSARRLHSVRTPRDQDRTSQEAFDYYVVPKKLYPYDLKSARQLTQQPVWVKEGYRYTYYPYDLARHRTDFSHEAGTLLPLQRLEIKDIATDFSPGSSDQRQVIAIFEQDGKTYAVPIGVAIGKDYRIYSDEMLFIQDPHELYKHWPSDIWESIGKHEVKPGMNELQTDFAVGMGVPEPSSDPSVKTVKYPNGGKPLVITYRNGKAAEIKAETPG